VPDLSPAPHKAVAAMPATHTPATTGEQIMTATGIRLLPKGNCNRYTKLPLTDNELFCSLPAGHGGSHQCGNVTWIEVASSLNAAGNDKEQTA